jgi:hypothetical protein
MAITNASTLAEYASGISTQGATLTVDKNNKRVGIGTTNPQAMLQVGTGVTVFGNAGIASFTSLKLSGETDSTSTSTGTLTVTGGVGIGLSLTVGGDVSVGGTITYEDVTNVDSIGIVTARSGLRVVGGGVTCVGVATFFNDVLAGHTSAIGDARLTVGKSAAGFTTAIALHNSHGSGTGCRINSSKSLVLGADYDDNTGVDGSIIAFETNATEKVRIDSSGRLLLGTTTEGEAYADNLTIADSGFCGITIRAGTTSQSAIYMSDATSGSGEYIGNIIYDHNDNHMRFATNATERLRIDSSGRVIIGFNASISNYGVQNRLQVAGTDYATSGIGIRRDSNDAGGGNIIFGKSRGSQGGVTVVQSGDSLGELVFCGADGTDVTSYAGTINCSVDGTPGSNDLPGRLTFSTAADGAAGVTERMRITAKGDIGINTTGVTYSDHIYLSIRGNSTSRGGVVHVGNSNHSVTGQFSVYDDKVWVHSGTSHPVVFGAGGASQHVTLATTGKLGIGVASPTRTLTVQSNGGQVALNDTDNTQGEMFVNGGDFSLYCRGNSNLGDGSTAGRFTVHTHPASGSIAERLRITGTGHMGLGVTPSAWPANGDSRGFQIGTGFAAFGRGSGDEDRGGIAVNYYSDGSGNKYIGNGHASRIYMNDGNIDFDYGASNSSGAGTALSLTTHMRIGSDGKVYINTTSSTATFTVKNINDSTLNAVEIFNDNGTVASGFSQSSSGDGTIFAKHADETLNVMFRSNGVSFVQGGDFGIGLNDPSCRLVVKDTAEHTAFDSTVPSITDCTVALSNNPPNETANDHCTIQFNVNGGSHNRVASISAVAESAGNRKMGLAFCTDDTGSRTEKMRISGDGHVLISKTSPDTTSAGHELRGGVSAQHIIGKSSSGAINGIYFHYNSTYVGGLNYSDTATSLATSSDYRIKENVVAVPNAITRTKQLNPVQFNFIADPDATVEGFIAHELGEVVPEACFGEKDAVDDDGNIKPQTVAQDKVIPLLTAALQEAIAEIETLKAKVAALESA